MFQLHQDIPLVVVELFSLGQMVTT